MLNRRSLFGAGTAAASYLASSLTARRAASKGLPHDLEPRGTTGRLERLPRLDLESLDNFHAGFRLWVNQDLTRAAKARADKILKANGLSCESEISTEQALDLLADEPLIGTRFRAWTTTQRMMWQNLLDEFHGNADAYLTEMEAADNAGPGTLELNPDMDIPDYCRHEIHVQPGGFVGDPFAGHVYHYGTNNFFEERNYQDELHVGLASAVPGPVEGGVRRILDMGCSCGQMSVALKERFPEAEVWGTDVGGPMVRYAHMRARDLGVDVNFAQRLAEDSKFPDGHFDIVTSYILHHEVNGQASIDIINEAYRILRPGGVFYPMDAYTGEVGQYPHRPPIKTAWDKLQYWWIVRWNFEVWFYEYADVDFPSEMRKAGFDLSWQADRGSPQSIKLGYKVLNNLVGAKPV